jgi:hypothetical protein
LVLASKTSRNQNMQKTKLLVMSVLAAVLLSSGFIALAAADEGISEASVSPSPEVSVPPDAPTPLPKGTGDNSTATNDARENDQTVHALNETEPLIAPAPGEGDLISINTGNPDLTLPLAVGAILAVAVGGAVGVVFYRRH